MAQTVRIDESTHALLRELADADNLSLQDELTLAVKARKREKFFAEMKAGYEAMTGEERAEEAGETAVWDTALGDGLEDE
jgi:hypothetical protein